MGEPYRQTSVSAGLDASDARARRDRYDRACKRLLSEKIILGWILHECLEEFSQVNPQEIADSLIEGDPEIGVVALHADGAAAPRITGLPTEDTSIAEGTVWFDIRFQALVPGSDEQVSMIVNIEAQNDFYPGYSLLQRATYYCARLLSSQYGRTFTNAHYERLRKVCSIWICPNPPARFRNTVTRYAMAEEQVVGKAMAHQREYDLLEIVLVCPDGDRQERGDGILRLLGMLIASEQGMEVRKAVIEDEFGIPMHEQLAGEVDEVMNLSKGVFERGIEQGIEQGLKQGIEQGIEQGVKQGLERGKAEERQLFARLAEALDEQGRASELVEALRDEAVFARLLTEFGLEE